MPRNCVHLEEIKSLLDKWEIKLNISSDDDYLISSWLGGLMRRDLSHCHYSTRTNYVWATIIRENMKQFNIGYDALSKFLLTEPKNFKKLEFHLKEVRNKLLSIINECNCEEKNNQQLVLRRSVENSLIIVKEESSRLQTQLAQRDKDIEWGKKELAKTQTERDDYQNKWVLSENEVKRITGLFNALQLENNKSKEKIKELKGELGQSRKDFLKQKISLKVGKLETFIQQLGVNRGKIMDNLLNAYKQLLRAEKNFNQNNIDEAENGINNIKQGLLTNGIIYRGISVDNTQKICSKCEKLAKLKLELNQIQQEQYQALQIQPSNN